MRKIKRGRPLQHGLSVFTRKLKPFPGASSWYALIFTTTLCPNCFHITPLSSSFLPEASFPGPHSVFSQHSNQSEPIKVEIKLCYSSTLESNSFPAHLKVQIPQRVLEATWSWYLVSSLASPPLHCPCPFYSSHISSHYSIKASLPLSEHLLFPLPGMFFLSVTIWLAHLLQPLLSFNFVVRPSLITLFIIPASLSSFPSMFHSSVFVPHLTDTPIYIF